MDWDLSARQKAKKYKEKDYDKVKQQGLSKRFQKKKLNEKRFREFLYDDNAKLSDYVKKKGDL